MIEVNRVALLLEAEWQRVDPKSGVAKHPVSYRANFADMAKVVVNDNMARGLFPPDTREIGVRIEEMLRERPMYTSEVITRLGVQHTTVIRQNVEDMIYDFVQAGAISIDPESRLHWIGV